MLLLTALGERDDRLAGLEAGADDFVTKPKYSPAGSTVRVAVRPSGSQVQIEVADRGAGIPNGLKEQLFQKFGSVESARGEARRGVGLGLYLVKLVATAHGGRTLVRDRRGGGTAVGLLVPSS